MSNVRARALTFVLAVFSLVPVSRSLAQPWDVFEGDCDTINAFNAGLVIIDEQFWLITDGEDFPLVDSFITADLEVFYEGIPSGSVVFDVDADGFEALFWVTDFGTVVEIDLDTLEIFDSDFAPGEILDTFCDPCDFWDDPLDCESCDLFDSDDDGVDDCIDECPDTLPGEIPDDLGCSCEDLGDCCEFFDSDDDGVDDCDDECPDTFPGELVDDFGCSCEDLGDCCDFFDSDDDGVDDCDDDCPDTFPGEIPDDFGCSCEDLDDCDVDVGPVFVSCAALQPWLFGVIFLGLAGLRSMRRRW